VGLLTLRSGARASQGACCLLILSFGTLCATIQIATMRCMDLHSSWKVYAGISIDFQKFASILQGDTPMNFIGFLWLVSPLGLHRISMVLFSAIHGASETCLDAAPLDQGCDGNEITYFADCNEGRSAAGSAWCPLPKIPRSWIPAHHHVGFRMQNYNGMLNDLSATGCLVQWHDSRFGCERSRVQFAEQPF
jgi:hypothetical protein